jgi:excisionase family DNA binding protein
MSSQPNPVTPVISVTATPEPYVDVRRAASYLAVAVKTLNEWARLQKIPAYQWGDGVRKTWRFKLSELDEINSLHSARRRWHPRRSRLDGAKDKLRSSSASFGKEC